jgi:hypothetical protein
MIVLPGGPALASFLLLCADCGEETHLPETLIRAYPADDLAGVVATDLASFDPEVSRDGKGSVRFDVREPTTVTVYEIRSIELPDEGRAHLAYRASLRTEELEGIVYLELVARFPKYGERMFQARQRPLGGTSAWERQEALLFLQSGYIPDSVQLNLVVEGRGTVWIDDVSLARVGS